MKQKLCEICTGCPKLAIVLVRTKTYAFGDFVFRQAFLAGVSAGVSRLLA
jgi:hypothetical protein